MPGAGQVDEPKIRITGVRVRLRDERPKRLPTGLIGALVHSEDISEEARENRRILLSAMGSAGLVNYGYEWWRFSYGIVTGPTPRAEAPPVTHLFSDLTTAAVPSTLWIA